MQTRQFYSITLMERVWRPQIQKLEVKVVENDEDAIVKCNDKYDKVHRAIPPPQDHLDFLTKLIKDVEPIFSGCRF
ncbi:uncharacterized protein G2W53_035440 [Senna tora]|uniref:Bet v I/Major latex protein domain-containing protein n=1 Tax=Senna tora TaxID=362788 RepID=A0A834SVS0_9FABA|nr:uncharacterized protein G2W53_035440 [Senna tora]